MSWRDSPNRQAVSSPSLSPRQVINSDLHMSHLHWCQWGQLSISCGVCLLPGWGRGDPHWRSESERLSSAPLPSPLLRFLSILCDHTLTRLRPRGVEVFVQGHTGQTQRLSQDLPGACLTRHQNRPHFPNSGSCHGLRVAPLRAQIPKCLPSVPNSLLPSQNRSHSLQHPTGRYLRCDSSSLKVPPPFSLLVRKDVAFPPLSCGCSWTCYPGSKSPFKQDSFDDEHLLCQLSCGAHPTRLDVWVN